jgi:hypothetical protein
MEAIVRFPQPTRLSRRRHTSRFVFSMGLVAAVALVPDGRLGASPTQRAATIVPILECVERGRGTDTFWFGADVDPLAPPQLIPAGWGISSDDPTNGVVELVDGDIIDRGPGRDQAEFFAAGLHHFLFSITVARGNQLEWTIAAGADPATPGAAPATVSTKDARRCRGDAPRWNALTVTDRSIPAIASAPGPTKSVGGVLIASSVVFRVDGVRSVCSAGGDPLPPVVLWGYDDSVKMANVGLQDEAPRDGFAPLPRRALVRTDLFAGGVVPYQRTLVGMRRVVDPQRVWVNPTNGTVSRGVAATMVLADVFGRCAFGHRVVIGTEPAFVPYSGLPSLLVTTTDEATQSTVQLHCTLEPDCPVLVVPGPGGVRWR